MAGFYGNISNSNKTAFTFDKVYGSRKSMDNACQSDNIFIGRYVLVEYDEPPLQGYLLIDANNSNVRTWYTDARYTTIMEVDTRKIYQNLNEENTDHSFYEYGSYVNNVGVTEVGWHPIAAAQTAYAASYNQDVKAYGRGYDSTAWMKIVDSQTNLYRYVLVAELNTVVPHFRLVADPPDSKPVAPYFDNATTNLDYYMHVQAPWGMRLNNVALDATYKTKRDNYREGQAQQYMAYSEANTPRTVGAVGPLDTSTFSDAEIQYYETTWNSETLQYVRQPSQTADGDLYFNMAGFDKQVPNFDNITANSIYFAYGRSGRLYGGADQQGQQQDDQMLWHVRLPIIGNTISEVWDQMFSPARKLLYLSENLQNANSCTIDTLSVLGIANTLRSHIGGAYPSLDQLNTYVPVEGTMSSPLITGEREFDMARNKTILSLSDNSYVYYYMPTYTAVYTAQNLTKAQAQAMEEPLYINDNGVYKLANYELQEDTGTKTYYTKVSENSENHFPYMRYRQFAQRDNSSAYGGWALVQNNEQLNTVPSTIFGVLAYTNRLLGTQLLKQDSRDERTVIGLMNRMRDTIANIDTQLVPDRWMRTAATGQIITSDVPYTIPDATRNGVLDEAGSWVARFYQIQFGAYNDAVTEPENASTVATITAVCPNNVFKFNNGNKWIKIASNNSNKTITLTHAVSAANAQANTNYGVAASPTSQFGMSFNVPHFTIDEAGHVTVLGETLVTIPTPSLTNDNSGNIVTGISLTPSTGTLVETKEDLGSLTLNTYSLGESDAAVASTDTLSVALGKLQTQMNNEVNARTTAIAVEQEARETAIAAEQEARETAITAEQEARTTAISAEATVRAEADANEATLRTNADSAESEARSNADTALSNRIDGITATSLGVGDFENKTVAGILDGYATEEGVTQTLTEYSTTTEINNMLSTLTDTIIANLVQNYGLTLTAPTVVLAWNENEQKLICSYSDSTLPGVYGSKLENYDSALDTWTTISESSDTVITVYDITANGRYRVTISRTLNGITVTSNAEQEITSFVTEPAPEEPGN